MAGITHADLLKLQEAITGSVRYEVGLAREEFREKFGALEESHQAQQRVLEQHGRELARLDERTRLSGRGFLASLSKKQKAALAGLAVAAGGSVIDGVRHLGQLLLAALQHGVRP